MATYVILVLALIGCAQAAPWRCYSAPDATVCYDNWGQPSIQPAAFNIERPRPPCVGQATVFTPGSCTPTPAPCPCQLPTPPCPCPQPIYPCPQPIYPIPQPIFPCAQPEPCSRCY